MLRLLIDATCKYCTSELDYSRISLRICRNCIEEMIKAIITNPCPKCGLPLLNHENVCFFCQKEKVLPERVVSIFEYKGIIADLIISYKYSLVKENSKIFVELLKVFNPLEIFHEDIDLVVPVPTSLTRLVQRGFYTLKHIFKDLSDRWGISYRNILLRKSFHKSQSKSTGQERKEMIKTQYFLKPGMEKEVKGKNILLVDDVFTTGSTLNRCCQILEEKGARKVFALTICRTLPAL